MEKKLKANLWKLYFIQAVNFFLVFIPVMVLFFQDRGLSMKQVLILESAFTLSLLLLQIPTGYIADLFGRHRSIQVGFLLMPVGYLIYSFSQDFNGFLLAEVILGISSSFISGADSALIYDTLAQLKKTGDYKKVEGKYNFFGNISEAIASVLGGFLATVSLILPLYVQTAVMFLAFPVVFTLVQPKIHHEDFHEEKIGNFSQMMKVIKFSLHEHKEVKWLIIYSAIIWTATFNMVWFIQPYEKSVGLPLFLFGVVWSSFQIATGFFSLYAHKIEKFFGRRNSLISLIIFVSASYLLIGLTHSLWGILFVYLMYLARGLHNPIIKDYINQIISPKYRATVLSVQGMAQKLLFTIFGPLIGWVNDLYSFQTAMLVSGGILLSLGVIALFYLSLNKVLSLPTINDSLIE